MKSTAFHIKAYDHGGILLSLSGYRDEEECTITRVTAADSEIDLFDLFQPSELARMGDCVDAQLSREAREEGFMARIERRVMDRAMAQLPELTTVMA